MNGSMIWMIISAVLAVVGALVLHFTFLSPKNDGKFNKFLGWMYDFLTFRKMMLESLLRVLYLIVVIFITLASFGAGSVPMFLLTLVVGNLGARIIYEFALIMLVICRNTSDISKKLNSTEVKSVETKKEVKVEEAKAE